MTESFSIPGVGGLVERVVDGRRCLLIQERYKADAPGEAGLMEIPAGKLRAFESVFDCLRREIREETGLEVVRIAGEEQSSTLELNGYRVTSYLPFSCAQNLKGSYPIMVQVFLCEVRGELLQATSETRNLAWVPIEELEERLRTQRHRFYPMHVRTLEKYVRRFS